MIDQKKIARQLKIAKMDDGDFTYSQIADMLDIKIGSLYNFLNNQYKLSQGKAKLLKDWLSDRE